MGEKTFEQRKQLEKANVSLLHDDVEGTEGRPVGDLLDDSISQSSSISIVYSINMYTYIYIYNISNISI